MSPKPFNRAQFLAESSLSKRLTHFVLHDVLNDRVQRFAKPAEEEEEEGEQPEGEEREFDNYGVNEPGHPYPGRPSTYQNWDNYQRMMWDNKQFHWEEQRLRDRQAEARRTAFEERMTERMTQVEGEMTRIRQDVKVMGYYQQWYHHNLLD